MLTADEAVGMGVVNQLSPSPADEGGALALALETGALICENAPLAVCATKEMMMRGLELSGLEAAYAARYPAF